MAYRKKLISFLLRKRRGHGFPSGSLWRKPSVARPSLIRIADSTVQPLVPVYSIMASKRNKKNKRKTMKKGGFAGLAARYYYPQNMLAQDPQRDITTSVIKGGCGCGMKAEQPMVKGGSRNRKNHSRKYLKRGGAGFFNNFGTTTGASSAASEITGAPKNTMEPQKPAFLV